MKNVPINGKKKIRRFCISNSVTLEGKYYLSTENSRWLRRSQKIAMEMLDRMESLGVNQKELAQRMGCSPQYVSKILRGKENLSLETICKIEDALEMEFKSVPIPVTASF